MDTHYAGTIAFHGIPRIDDYFYRLWIKSFDKPLKHGDTVHFWKSTITPPYLKQFFESCELDLKKPFLSAEQNLIESDLKGVAMPEINVGIIGHVDHGNASLKSFIESCCNQPPKRDIIYLHPLEFEIYKDQLTIDEMVTALKPAKEKRHNWKPRTYFNG